MFCRPEPLRNHVRFSPMPSEQDWRAPHTSTNSRPGSPIQVDLDPRSSSEDLIANANPNLNGIDPARAKWSLKGTMSQSASGSSASCCCAVTSYVLLGVMRTDLVSFKYPGAVTVLHHIGCAATVTRWVCVQTDGAQAISFPVSAAANANSLVRRARAMAWRVCGTWRSSCLTWRTWTLTTPMSQGAFDKEIY